MYAAFDNDDDDDAVEDIHQTSQPLLGPRTLAADQTQHPLESSSQDNLNSTFDNATTYPPLTRHTSSRSVAGTYDFEYDYAMLPPPGSPPRPSQLALPNSYGNTNGLLPTSPPSPTVRTPGLLRRAFGAILPTHYTHDRRGGGLGNDGVFGNVVAKPGRPGHARGTENAEGPHFVPEEAQKDAPPVRFLMEPFSRPGSVSCSIPLLTVVSSCASRCGASILGEHYPRPQRSP
jgi:hypothetical protein